MARSIPLHRSFFKAAPLVGACILAVCTTAGQGPSGPAITAPIAVAQTSSVPTVAPATSAPPSAPAPTSSAPVATSTPAPGEPPPCAARSLGAAAGLQGATGSVAGSVLISNVGPTTCRLRGTPDVSIINSRGEVLSVQFAPTGRGAGGTDAKVGAVLPQGAQTRTFVAWQNWCGSRDATVTLVLTLPETAEKLAAPVVGPNGDAIAAYPRCDTAGGSILSVDAFAPRQ